MTDDQVRELRDRMARVEQGVSDASHSSGKLWEAHHKVNTQVAVLNNDVETLAGTVTAHGEWGRRLAWIIISFVVLGLLAKLWAS